MNRQFFIAAALGTACTIPPALAEAQYYDTTNIALGKAVLAPTPTALGGPPSIVTDGKGDPYNYWYSYPAQEFTVDLGAPIPIGRIVVSVVQASRLTISSSLDNVTFVAQHALDSTDAQHSNWIGAMAQGPLTFQVDGAYTARYLKYRSVDAGCGCYQGVHEFAVYEWVGSPPPTLSGGNLAALPGTHVADVHAATSLAGYPAANLADGNPGTSWIGSMTGAYTAMAGRQLYVVIGWAEIDLGAENFVHGLRVRRPDAGGAQTVSVSLFNTSHTEVAWFGLGDPSVVATDHPAFGDADFVLESPVHARYVSVVQWSPAVTSPAIRPALAEVEVYGAVDPPVNLDGDDDGVFDSSDNCPLTANSDQADFDADGLGDACDLDDDNDAVPDVDDRFPVNPAEWTDTDGDEVGDNADLDDDNDGQRDADEAVCGSNPMDPGSAATDLDGDGEPDCVDPDMDGDGVLNSADNCRLVANTSQTDTDNDGVGDTCDADDDNDGFLDGADSCQLVAGTVNGCPGPALIGPPTNNDQCKNGGWKIFDVPEQFKNQGACVSFVESRRGGPQ